LSTATTVVMLYSLTSKFKYCIFLNAFGFIKSPLQLSTLTFMIFSGVHPEYSCISSQQKQQQQQNPLFDFPAFKSITYDCNLGLHWL